MRKLYKYYCDCGGMGNLEGLFIADPKTVKEAIGKTISWGDVLGKHSDIDDTLDKGSFEIISEDQEKTNWLQDLLGESVSGYNPIEQYLEQKEEGYYE